MMTTRRSTSKRSVGRTSKKALKKTTRTSTAKKTAPKSHKKKLKADSPVQLFWKLREVLPELESRSYFELDRQTKKLLANFEGIRNGLPTIEAWTFTLHPLVIEAFIGRDKPLKRYILTIDTLRSTVYTPVKDFLENHKTNITSYYTGGWADFLCDLQMDQQSFNDFLEELKSVLRGAGIEEIVGEGKVDEVISIFEVIEPIIICRRPVRGLSIPSTDTINSVLKEPVKFETVYRDYRSAESLKIFDNNEKKLKAYLGKLKAEGIIVCYKIIFDFSFGITRDYVPMILGSDREGPVTRLLTDAKEEPELLKPVREWLKVRPIHPADDAEREVNYFFLNEYDYPGRKTKWKQAIYHHSKIDVNLYNYPLESTLNESPIYLSNLPEVLADAKKYGRNTKDRRMFIGWASHPLLEASPEVALPSGGLARQGVTLGEPGSGKTNTDLVIASEAAEFLKTVIIVDASGGIDSKAGALSEELRNKLNSIELSAKNADTKIGSIINEEGFFLVKAMKSDLPTIFSEIMKHIDQSADPTSNNESRKINKLLIVEEAGDALGTTPDEVRTNVTQLSHLLTKAWRKGWCIWLSTQRPSSLGYDKESAISILTLLQNRVVSNLKNENEIGILLDVFRSEGYSEDKLESIKSSVKDLQLGEAICRAVDTLGVKDRFLPLLKVKIRLL